MCAFAVFSPSRSSPLIFALQAGRVTGIGLPEKLRDQIAQELAKKYP